MDSYEILLPYQKAWINDTSGVKVREKFRRIGASYVEALAAVLEAAKSREAGGQSAARRGDHHSDKVKAGYRSKG